MRVTITAALVVAAMMAASPVYAWEGTAKLTFYCSACNTPKGSNDGAYGPVQMGDIAADPRYWKRGSRVTIEGLGTFRVRDTGGAIKGRGRFDVWRGWKKKCDCSKSGVQYKRYKRAK